MPSSLASRRHRHRFVVVVCDAIGRLTSSFSDESVAVPSMPCVPLGTRRQALGHRWQNLYAYSAADVTADASQHLNA
jgi:hypothetical protein